MEAERVKPSNVGNAVGVLLIGLGVLSLLGLVLPSIQRLLWAAALLGGAALAYSVSHREPRRRWLLIPAYGMASLGVMIVLWQVLNGLRLPADTIKSLMVSALFGEMAVPFFYLYVRKLVPWWVALPGAAAAVLSGVSLLVAIGPAVPALMIAGGLYLVIRSVRTRPPASPAPLVAVAEPLTGPAADRPLSSN